jgi:hypothetical protein
VGYVSTPSAAKHSQKPRSAGVLAAKIPAVVLEDPNLWSEADHGLGSHQAEKQGGARPAFPEARRNATRSRGRRASSQQRFRQSCYEQTRLRPRRFAS